MDGTWIKPPEISIESLLREYLSGKMNTIILHGMEQEIPATEENKVKFMKTEIFRRDKKQREMKMQPLKCKQETTNNKKIKMDPSSKKLVSLPTSETNRQSGHDDDNNDIDTIDNLENDNRTEEFNIDQTYTGNTNTGNSGTVKDKDSMKIHLQVLDLTPYEFNNDTINLLLKGLSFTPTPSSRKPI